MDLRNEDDEQRRPPLSGYDYDDAAPGMQDAVERARHRPPAEMSDLAMVDELIRGSPANDPRPATERPAKSGPTPRPLLTKPNPEQPNAAQQANAATVEAGEWSLPEFKSSAPPMAPLAMSEVPRGPEAVERDARHGLRLKAIREAGRLLDSPARSAPVFGDDEALRELQRRDREQTQRNNFTEALAAAIARRPAQLAPVPSETSDLLTRRNELEKRRAFGSTPNSSLNQLLSAALRGENKIEDPLAEFHRTQIEKWRADNQRHADEAKRKADEAAAKTKNAEDATTTEAAEVEAAKRALVESPAGKRAGLTAEDLADVTTRKGLEPFLRVMGMRGPKAQAAPNPENNAVPFLAGTLRPRAGTTPTKEDRKKVQEISSLYGGAFEGMDSLEQALRDYAAHPSAETKRTVESQVQGVATALNSAYGQGAMAENEAKNIKEALGADLLSPTGVQALAQSLVSDDGQAAKTLLTRLKAARQVTERIARGKVKAYNFEFSGGETPPAEQSADPVVTLTAKDGRTKRVRRSVAAEYLRTHPGEATVSE